MRKSTILRDLAGVLDQYVQQLESAGITGWAKHLRQDAEDLRSGAAREARYEPPRQSIESLAGSIPDLTGGLSSEDYVRKLRGG